MLTAFSSGNSLLLPQPRVATSGLGQAVLPVIFSAYLLVLPFQWATVGNLSVTWPAAGLLLLTVVGTVGLPRFVLQLSRFFHRAPLFHLGSAAYVLIYLVASLIQETELGPVIRMSGVLIQYAIFGSALESLSSRTIGRTMLIAVPLSLLGFVLYSQFVFWSMGTTFITVFHNALATGDYRRVTYDVVKAIVRFDGASTQGSVEALGSVQNFFGVFTVVAWFSLLAFRPLLASSRLPVRILSMSGLLLSPMILVTILMSRSAIVSLVVGTAMAAVCRTWSSPSRQVIGIGVRNLLFLAAAIGGMSVSAWTLLGDNQILENVSARFLQIADDPRIEHYAATFQLVSEHPLAGNGASRSAPDGYQVHNYFLGAWYQLGIVGLFVSLLTWFGIVGVWMRNAIRMVLAPDGGVVDSAFLAALPLTSLFRRLIAGDCGRFLLIEMLAIALFLLFSAPGAVHRNRS